MKKHFRYSTAILLSGLLLGLAGCGSSDNTTCPSGEQMTTGGCGTSSCTVPGTNQAGALVGSACDALSSSATSAGYSCQANYSLQPLPPPYNTMPQYAQYGYQVCCPSGDNISQYPQGLNACQLPINTSTTGTGTVGGACPIPGYPQGYIYAGGSTCYP